jgi:hypothetical protein
LGVAAEEGRNDRLEKAKQGGIPFEITHNLIMPEEFDAQQNQHTETEEVIDLREKKEGAAIRFANPEDVKT